MTENEGAVESPGLWKDRRFLIVFVASILLSPVFVLAALGGSRHMLSSDACLAFPYAVVLFQSADHIAQDPDFVLAIVGVAFLILFAPVPFYVVVVSRALRSGNFRPVVHYSVAHLAAALIGLALYD